MNVEENIVGKHSDAEELIPFWERLDQLVGEVRNFLEEKSSTWPCCLPWGCFGEDWEVRNFLEEERATWPCRLPWGCFVKTQISNPGRVRHSMRTLSDVDVADVVFDA